MIWFCLALFTIHFLFDSLLSFFPTLMTFRSYKYDHFLFFHFQIVSYIFNHILVIILDIMMCILASLWVNTNHSVYISLKSNRNFETLNYIYLPLCPMFFITSYISVWSFVIFSISFLNFSFYSCIVFLIVLNYLFAFCCRILSILKTVTSSSLLGIFYISISLWSVTRSLL